MKLFSYTKSQRRGLIILVILVLALQIVLFRTYIEGESSPSFVFREDIQKKIDSLRAVYVKDSIRKRVVKPFNPNYISDYKGHVLGLTPKEIDRLNSYREKGLFVNSPKEFQHITEISDSLLRSISPYFKFPKWKKNDKKIIYDVKIKDINQATAKDLTSVYGIGKILSERIVKYREALGGYLTDEQLYEVYGLKKEVVKRLLRRYRVISPPQIQKLDINKISANRLSKLPYLSYGQALKIIAYRTQSARINSWDSLKVILDSVTLSKLKLYLEISKFER